MLDKEFITFKESGFKQPDNYFPQYQITKLASDTYQIYDFIKREASLCSAKETLKTVSSLRGGKPLNRELSSKIMNMSDFQTYTIDNSALKISKKASADLEHEPWKLVVAADGNEYFVSADAEVDEEEKVTKTAASNIKHVYSVKIQAHNIREIAKIADMAEKNLHAVAGTTQIPDQNVICFDVVSETTPEEAQASIQKEIEGGTIYLPDSCCTVDNSCCPCGCGKHSILPCPEEQEVSEYVVPQNIPEGEFALTSPETVVISVASNIYTLRKYAESKYDNYRIYDSNHAVIAEMKDGVELDPSKETFGDELTAFLNEQLSKKAEGNVEVIGPDRTVKNEGSDLQQGDDIVNTETGEVTKVTEVSGSESSLLQAVAGVDVTKGAELKQLFDRVNSLVERAKNFENIQHLRTEILFEQEALEKFLKNYDGSNIVFPEIGEIAQDEVARYVGSLNDMLNDLLIKIRNQRHEPKGSPSLTGVKKVAEDSDNITTNAIPGEKDPNDTKATGDEDVKKWKGMREDPSSGKFVVYITETEEHIFDNITDATNFLTKRD